MFSFDIGSNFAHLSATLKKINFKILGKKTKKNRRVTDMKESVEAMMLPVTSSA